ncbi:MAG: hypothetical protein ACOC4E_01320 [Patescibacteria group bacterium]
MRFPAIRCETHHFINGPAGVFLSEQAAQLCRQPVPVDVQDRLLEALFQRLAEPRTDSVELHRTTLLPRELRHPVKPQVRLSQQEEDPPRAGTCYYGLSHVRHHSGHNNWLLCAFVTWFEVVDEHFAHAPVQYAGLQ